MSIDDLLKKAGYTSDPSDKPYAGKRVYRDGVLMGTFHVQTIWRVPGLLVALRDVDPAEADAVEASIRAGSTASPTSSAPLHGEQR